jgi:hypothetical protein
MTSKRPVVLAVLALSCVGAPLVTAASASAGWRVARLISGGTYAVRASATLCGSATFGTYRLVSDGNLHGRTLHSRGTVSLLNDGRYHAFHITSISGTLFTGLPSSAQAAVRRSLDATTIKVVRLRGNVLTTSFRLAGAAPMTGHATLQHIISC